ncbi:MAG: sialate O-acetylesterase [Sphingobacterium sp.]
MIRKLFLIIWAISLGSQSTSWAQLRLPNFFSDHMVLQRETPINFWGWGDAGSTIELTGTWFSDTISAKVDGNGHWKVVLPEGTAGGPYQLQINADQKSIVLDDLLLGDVFLCSGQSNMEWGGNQNLQEIIEELPQANNPNIRLLQISRKADRYPQSQTPDSWDRLTTESLKPFSGIGYFIAKRIHQEENIPIGVINASWGGTAAETWTPEHLIHHDPFLKKKAEKQQAGDYRPHQAGSTWNSMIHPLAGYNLSAAFWYQGESNVGTWDGYDKLMKTLVSSWRSAWNIDFPFYFVQIAPFQYNNAQPLAALLREQQVKTALELPQTGMVVITDLVDNIQDIHPSQKKDVANRLADLALVEIYGQEIKDYQSPVYQSHEIKGNTIEISFHHLDGNLKAEGELTELYIAGADQVFKAAKGKIRGNKLIVESPAVKSPEAVRFGFSETAIPNLFNSRGLPVSPFRTDKWSL